VNRKSAFTSSTCSPIARRPPPCAPIIDRDPYPIDRLWFASFACVLLAGLRRIGLRHTRLARATCGTIRLKLLKIGAQLRPGVRRLKVAMASACPYQDAYHLAYLYPRRAAAFCAPLAQPAQGPVLAADPP